MIVGSYFTYGNFAQKAEGSGIMLGFPATAIALPHSEPSWGLFSGRFEHWTDSKLSHLDVQVGKWLCHISGPDVCRMSLFG